MAGPAHVSHEFIFVPDAGPVIANLVNCEDCYGERWNLRCGRRQRRDFVTAIYGAAGREPRWRSGGRAALKIGGFFNPLLKELEEMFYLQERPVLLDERQTAIAPGRGPQDSIQGGGSGKRWSG
jgi:hypothetical protein